MSTDTATGIDIYLAKGMWALRSPVITSHHGPVGVAFRRAWHGEARFYIATIDDVVELGRSIVRATPSGSGEAYDRWIRYLDPLSAGTWPVAASDLDGLEWEADPEYSGPVGDVVEYAVDDSLAAAWCRVSYTDGSVDYLTYRGEIPADPAHIPQSDWAPVVVVPE